MQHSPQPRLHGIYRTHHAKRIQQRAKREHDYQRCQILPAREVPNPRPERIRHQLTRRHAAQDANVVVRAGVNAVQAERAIHVSNLAGLKQSEFAAANRHQIRNRLPSATDAVLGMAARANILLAHFHFERRKCGSHKVELSDGANKLAKRSVFEKPVDHENGKKVGNDQPGRPPRRRPQTRTARK